MEETEHIPWYLSNEYREDSTGFMVETNRGTIGRTYHDKGMVNGKMPVYFDDKSMPMLCKPENLIFISKIENDEQFD
jgi:hypothetical protein